MSSETNSLPFPYRREHPLHPPNLYIGLRTSCPVAMVEFETGDTAHLVTRHADVRSALQSPATTANTMTPGFPKVSLGQTAFHELGTFIREDPPEHTLHRRMITREFSVQSVRSLRPVIQHVVDGLIEDMLRVGPPTDLVEAFSQALPAKLISLMLGVPESEYPNFRRITATMTSSKVTPGEQRAASEALLTYFDQHVKRLYEQPSDNLLSRLIEAQVRTLQLSLEEAAQIGRLLLIGGFETTAGALSVGVVALLTSRPELERVVASGDWRLATEELLRYVAPSHYGVLRLAKEDFELGGCPIAGGDGVLASLLSANRDSEVFAEPDSLDLERRPNPHLAFGFGVHQCLGQNLARAEIEIALSSLFERIPGLHLVDDVDSIDFRRDAIVYGIDQLAVAW